MCLFHDRALHFKGVRSGFLVRRTGRRNLFRKSSTLFSLLLLYISAGLKKTLAFFIKNFPLFPIFLFDIEKMPYFRRFAAEKNFEKSQKISGNRVKSPCFRKIFIGYFPKISPLQPQRYALRRQRIRELPFRQQPFRQQSGT